jgi:pyruvate carboxylase
MLRMVAKRSREMMQVGSPMPGIISRVFVPSGQTINAGDVLVSIETMKMETALYAKKDATISEVLVKAGDHIDAKDLLVLSRRGAVPSGQVGS